MNYRHIYHAGNFADVIKHIGLLLCVDYLRRKEGGLCFIDAHAGAGRYDLQSEEAGKTGEWRKGVGLLADRADAPADVAAYLDAIREDLREGHYPGSPLLIARNLRPQDRLIASELHPETFDALKASLAPFARARAMAMDAYQCVRAHIPPSERRGLVLVDPPFEKKDEFETLARQMAQWKKRWARGVFLMWYPIKAHLPVEALKRAAREVGFARTFVLEALVGPRDAPLTLNGCGLILFNAPYTVPERLEAVCDHLERALHLHRTVRDWLVGDLP